MGLRQEITNDLRAEIKGDLADAFHELTIFKKGSSTRLNGEVTSQTTPHTVLATEDNGSIFNQELEIEEGTKYLLFLQDDLNISPDLRMKAEYKGVSYLIRDMREDPASVTWVLKCEKT